MNENHIVSDFNVEHKYACEVAYFHSFQQSLPVGKIHT